MSQSALRWPTYAMRDVVLRGAAESDDHGSLFVVDTEGNRYLDAVAGIGCAVLGHGHPRFVAALTSQASRLVASANT